MKNYFWLAVAFVGLNIGAASIYADMEAEEYEGNQYYYGEGSGSDVRWIGPGYYGGIWIGNEDDFNNYHNHNNDNYQHGNDYHGDHGNDYHGGGDRGGGGGRGGGGHR